MLQPCSAHYWLRLVMICLSIMMQLGASCLLITERFHSRRREFGQCIQHNLAITILVFLVIAVNVIIAAFGDSNQCLSDDP